MQLTFTAYIEAAPQGSKRHVGNGVMVESSKKVKPYRHDLALLAQAERGDFYAKKGVPIALVVDFQFARPASAQKRVHHTVKPDLDKLIRATKDALKGILYDDDSQVVEVAATKNYGIPQVHISIYTLSERNPE